MSPHDIASHEISHDCMTRHYTRLEPSRGMASHQMDSLPVITTVPRRQQNPTWFSSRGIRQATRKLRHWIRSVEKERKSPRKERNTADCCRISQNTASLVTKHVCRHVIMTSISPISSLERMNPNAFSLFTVNYGISQKFLEEEANQVRV